MAAPKFTIDADAQIAGSQRPASRTANTPSGDVYFGVPKAMPSAPPPRAKPKEEEGFWTKTGRAALGGLERAGGALLEYLPETVAELPATAVDILAAAGTSPTEAARFREERAKRTDAASLVRAKTAPITAQVAKPYREFVKPVTSALDVEGRRQEQLAGPGKFLAPSQQKEFSIAETLGYGAEQGLRSSGSAVLGLGVGALTRSPAAARTTMGAASYGQTLSGVLDSQQQQGFQDVGLAAKASMASAALDVLTGGEAKVAQAAAKEVKQQLFREGAVNLSKDLLKLGAGESFTEMGQTVFERMGARKDLFSKDAINEYIDSAAGGFGGGVVMGGGVRLLTRNRKPAESQSALESAGSDLLETPAAEAKTAPAVTPSFVEKDADDNDVVNMETIRANPKMAMDELSELYSRDNIITSLAGDTEADGFTTSLGARLHRAITSGNAKSIPNLVRNLKRDIDADIHGEEVAAQRAPLVAKAALMLGDYVGLRNEAMAADERATNPALVAETAAQNNANELARVQAVRQQEQDQITAEQARVDAERQMQLDNAAKEVEGIHRKGFLDAVAKDPKTRDPVARFTALLKRNGFNPEITAQEQIELTKAAVGAEQRLASEAAQMDMTVAEYKRKLAEDDMRQQQAESGTASMEAQIREAGSRAPTAAMAPKPAPMPAGKTNRAAPENFQLEMQRELTDADIEAQQKAAARRQAKEDRALAKSNARAERRAAKAQGQLFTPTGRPTKAATAAPAPKATVATQIKEKVSAAKEGQKPKGSVAERQGTNEKRQAAEAGRSNRLEPSTQVEEKVTHEQVAERANEAKQNGYINEPTRQRIALLAEQKNVPAETLNKMLDQAIERGAVESKLKPTKAKGEKLKESTRAERAAMTDELQQELQRLGLNKVGLAVVADLIETAQGKAEGLYQAGSAAEARSGFRSLINIVFNDLAKALETLHHEAIHYMRDANLITAEEWKTLTNIVKADKNLMSHIRDNWKGLSEESQIEEAVAEKFREWMRTQKAIAPGIRGVFQRMRNFFNTVRLGFNKPAFAEAKAIFQSINAGERNDRNVTSLRSDTLKDGAIKLSVEKRFKDLPPSVRNSILYVGDTFSNHSGRFLTALGFTENLIEDAQKLIPAVKDYLGLMRKKMAAKEKIEVGINDLRERFQRLGLKRQGSEAGTINSFLQQTVDAQKWGFKPDWLQEGDYEMDSDVETAFKRLPKEEQQIVKDTLRTTYDMLKLRIDTAVASVNSLYDGMIEQAIESDDSKLMDKLDKEKRNALAQYQGLFRARQNVPYVSKRRNGDYIVVAKSAELIAAQEANDQKLIDKLVSQEEHYFVDMYDSMAEAKAKQRQLTEKGFYSEGSVRASETDKATEQFVGSRDMMVAYDRLRSQIQQLATSPDGKSGPSKKVVKDMERLAIDLYLTSLENSSARKSELKKKNVAADQLDMMRNFVSQGVAEANLIASMMYSGKVEQALREMRAQAFSDRQADPEKAARYYNEIALRHASSLGDAPSSFAELVKSVTSTMMLALSPSYYMTNLTQPWVLSVPYMAGEHAYNKVVTEMTQSYEEVTKAWKDVPLLSALNLENLSADVRNELQVLSERGQIDIGMNKELGQFSSLNKNAVENSFNKVGNVIRATAQKVESINRVSTAAAAVRLAKEKGLNSEQAVEYAGKVIRLTHGPYDSFNAPRWMRGPFLSTITQFKKFQLMQLTLIGKLVSGAVSKGATADAKLERSIARRQLAYTLGHTAVLTGVKGTFGYAAITFMINTILNAIADEDDEPADIEKLMYEKLGDFADVIMSGAPALAGLDISDRIGMGQALSVIPYVDPELSRQGYEKAIIGILGPGVAAFGKLADGLGTIYSGDYLRGLELMLPNGLDDGIKAFRESSEGVKTRKGDALLKPDEISFADSFVTAMGLRTTEVSKRYREQDDVKKIDQFYKDKTGELKREYLKAKDAGNDAKEDQVRARWRDIQDSREAAGLKRQPISTLLKARAERKRQEEMTAGGVQYRYKDRRFQRAEEDEE